MDKVSNAPRRATGRSVNIIAFVLSGLLVMSGVMGPQTKVLADGGLESEKGGLFHRKGWIMPAIYRRDPSKMVLKWQRGNSKSDRRRTGAKVRMASLHKKRDDSERAVQRRGRRPKKNLRRRAAKVSIPKTVIRRRERKIVQPVARSSKPMSESVKVASLGVDLMTLPKSAQGKPGKSLTGGSARINWLASSRCLPGRLRAAINYVARNFGSVRVNSTCRSRRRNRRVGGASRSYHLVSRAADFRVFGNIRKAARYLRRVAGGYKHYGGGLFHIDTGPRRSW